MKMYLKDYTSPAYNVTDISLHFNLGEQKTIVTSIMTVKKLRDEPLVLNGVDLTLISLEIKNQPVSKDSDSTPIYQLTAENLIVPAAALADYFTLKIKVQINPSTNKSCEGLYLSNGIFCTQCEAESFRKITYMLDRPDVMTTYTVEIEADKIKYPYLLSNGDCVGQKNLNNGRHSVLWKDPFKKPSYLFALVAGDMAVIKDHFVTASGKNVNLEIFTNHGKEHRCLHAMKSLKKAMAWDEERFDLEYDLNQYMIVAIDDFNMGAMENKGLNIFNSKLVLADTITATDDDFEAIESVVGHEYFHNWTGNRVTCQSWFDLSLKEGLTVFRDQEFSSDLNSRAVQRIKDVKSLRSRQFSEDAGPNAHPVRPRSSQAVDNFYTPTIYEKGAEIIRMMQTMVGKKGFKLGMKEYFKRHDGEAVTIEQFTAAISESNAVDFTQFKLWYSQAGTPEVSVREKYDAITKKYYLTLSQKCDLTPTEKKESFTKHPFHIPILIGLIAADGSELPLKSKDINFNTEEQAILHLKEFEQTFVFDEILEKPFLSINRDFSAPIILHWETTQQVLLHLIKHDSNSFNKYEFFQKLLIQETKKIILQLQRKQLSYQAEIDVIIIQALGNIISDKNLDPAFKALMLTLPGNSSLIRELEVLDAKIFEHARRLIQQAVTEKYGELMLQAYHDLQPLNKAAERILKNTLLEYLFKSKFSNALLVTEAQYINATNMTDSIAALNLLCESETVQRDESLMHFFDRWAKDNVVFSKWLSAQAGSSAADTFVKVQQIAKSPFFNSQNPNSIYSLHGVFGKNYIALNTEDGKPYEWLCDEIIKIDSWNPQVAARLCATFNYVQKFPKLQKENALQEIKRVLSYEKLSSNTRELLEKCI